MLMIDPHNAFWVVIMILVVGGTVVAVVDTWTKPW